MHYSVTYSDTTTTTTHPNLLTHLSPHSPTPTSLPDLPSPHPALLLSPPSPHSHQLTPAVLTVTELKTMTSGQLQELMGQLEHSLKQLSEMMMTEDALRDELDYDKDLKNSFISLLLSNQKKRRDSSADRKKKKHRNSHGQVVVDPACPTPEADSSVSRCC